METITYVLALIGCGTIGYTLTPKLLKCFIGEILLARGTDGKTYRVLKRPNESEKSAVARLMAKMVKAGAFVSGDKL